MTKRRIVVTGMGAVTPLGHDVESTWEALLAGKSGVTPITHFDASEFAVRFSASVKDFDVEAYLSKKDARKMDLFIQYGLAASIQALKDSGLEINDSNAHRIGAAIGAGMGGLDLIEANHTQLQKSGPRRISPFFVPSTIINMIAGHRPSCMASLALTLRSPPLALLACTTSVTQPV